MADILENPALLQRKRAAALCGVSPQRWDTWMHAGLTPMPLVIAGKRYWRKTELLGWVEAGCPRRNVWEPYAAVAFGKEGAGK